MAKSINKTNFLATNLNNEHDQETNSNEDIILKQQKLKVIIFLIKSKKKIYI
jgi:hypothetical protein